MTAARTTGHFDGFNFDGFWDESQWSQKYTEPAPSDELIAEVEAELGFRLPDAYVELARLRNGGSLERCCFPMDEPTSWAEDHIAASGIFAIGREARYALLGDISSPFMRDEWGYPDWGISFADTPSAGHEMIMLDYRDCGPAGEPSVVHVDQESDYLVTKVAPNFAAFIRGLVTEDVYDDSAEMADAALATVQRGTLSPILRRALDAAADDLPNGEVILRHLAEQIVREKGHFSLHNDGKSWQLYDATFWLYSKLATAVSFDDYYDRAEGQADYERACHVLMLRYDLVAEPFGFHTGGAAKDFVRDWWDAKLAAGAVIETDQGFRFAEDYEQAMLRVLRASGPPA